MVLGALMLVIVASLGLWRWRLHQDVTQRVATMKRAGHPATAKELDVWYQSVPAEENAALFYEALFKEMPTNQQIWNFPLLSRTEVFTASLSNRLATVVAANSNALRLAKVRTSKTRVRYSVDLSEGVNAQLPHLTKLKHLSQVLRAEAVIATEQNRPGDAAQSIEAILKAARTLDSEPILISPLVALAMDANASLALERLLNRTSLSENELEALSRKFQQVERTNRFVNGLIADRAIFSELIRMAQYDIAKLQSIAPRDEGEESEPKRTVQPGLGWNLIGFFERDYAFYLRAMETNIAVARLSPPASLRATNEIDAMNAKAKSDYYIFSSLLLPAAAKLPFRDADASARSHITLAVIAIERFRQSHGGKLPDDLQELVPNYLLSVPLDPFDGSSIRYRKLQRGYVVYSIGRDRMDDSGKEQPARGTRVPRVERNRFDITFVVER